MQDNSQTNESRSWDHLTLLMDIRSEVQAIRTELVEFKKDVSKAFPKDDDGLPDYAAHRKKHEKENREENTFSEYKVDFVKDIVKWAARGIIAFLIAASIYYLKALPHP